MGNMKEKLAYLNDTKTAIKTAIESNTSTVIPDKTTFRQYADEITRSYNEIERQLNEVQTMVRALDRKKNNMITNSSTTAGGATVLNIEGAGELHFVSAKTEVTDLPSSGSYLKLIFDKKFTMYLPLGDVSTYQSSGWAGNSACYSVSDYLVGHYSGNLAPVLFSFKKGIVNLNLASPTKKPWWYEDGQKFKNAFVNDFVSGVIDRNKNLDTAQSFISTLKPLRFDNSLEIKFINGFLSKPWTTVFNTAYVLY